MLDSLKDFLEPISLAQLSNDEGFTDKQLANHISIFENDLPNIDKADIVIIGCGESRGDGPEHNFNDGPNEIRAELYKLYHWHRNVHIADFGNIKQGADIKDTYAALQMIVAELMSLNKRVLIIGGSLGAKSINDAIEQGFEELIANDIQLIWQTGKTNSQHVPRRQISMM